MNWEEFKGEWNDRPFEGYYVNKEGGAASISDLELISPIVDNLFVGGCEPVDLEDFFSHIFSLYMWGAYDTGLDTEYVVYKMYDTTSGIEIQDQLENPVDVDDVVDDIIAALNLGGNVLVHCQAGINRSNLLSGLVLMKWKNMSADEAIALLRERRHQHALANPLFERYLRSRDNVS